MILFGISIILSLPLYFSRYLSLNIYLSASSYFYIFLYFFSFFPTGNSELEVRPFRNIFQIQENTGTYIRSLSEYVFDLGSVFMEKRHIFPVYPVTFILLF